MSCIKQTLAILLLTLGCVLVLSSVTRADNDEEKSTGHNKAKATAKQGHDDDRDTSHKTKANGKHDDEEADEEDEAPAKKGDQHAQKVSVQKVREERQTQR